VVVVGDVGVDVGTVSGEQVGSTMVAVGSGASAGGAGVSVEIGVPVGVGTGVSVSVSIGVFVKVGSKISVSPVDERVSAGTELESFPQPSGSISDADIKTNTRRLSVKT
jgi:hypothetical protein